jgi:hypothetical protein
MAVLERQNLIERQYWPREVVVVALKEPQTPDWPFHPSEADPQAALATVKLGGRLRFPYEGDQRVASETRSPL